MVEGSVPPSDHDEQSPIGASPAPPSSFPPPPPGAAAVVSASPPSPQRPAPRRRGTRRPVIVVGIVVVLALVAAGVVLWQRDRGGDGVEASLELTALGSVNQLTVDRSGGTFSVVDPGDPLHGLRVNVPSGAVTSPTSLSFQATAYPEEMVGGDLLVRGAALDRLAMSTLDLANPVTAIHPLLGLLYLLDGAVMAGPSIQMGPNETEFARPVRIELPASMWEASRDLGDEYELIVVLADDDGVEIIDADVLADGGLAVEVAHFSILSVLALTGVAAVGLGWYFEQGDLAAWVAGAAFDKLRKAGRNVPELIRFQLGMGPVNDALARLPAPGAFAEQFGRGAACAGVHIGPMNPADLPGIWELLKWLGWHADGSPKVRRPAAEQHLTAEIEDRARRVSDGTAVPWGPADVFRSALEATSGDLYGALIASHNVLYSQRARLRGALAGALAPIRGDDGDETGAYYHLFGMATFALVTVTWAQFGPDGPVDPGKVRLAEFAATIEEAFVASDSGDITGDPTEYAVDLIGAELGRELYSSLAGQRRGQLEQRYGITPSDCDERVPMPEGGVIPVSGGYYAVLIADPGILSVRPVDVVDAGEIGMCRFRHGGRDCEQPAVMTKLRDEPFPDAESATDFICEQLGADTFRSPPLADGWVADYQGRSMTIDDWGSLQIGRCRDLVNS